MEDCIKTIMCVIIFLGGIHKMKYAEGSTTFVPFLNGTDSANGFNTPYYPGKSTDKIINETFTSPPNLRSTSEPLRNVTSESTSQSIYMDLEVSSVLHNDSKDCCDSLNRSEHSSKDIKRNIATTIYIGGLFELSGSRDNGCGYSELTAAKLAVSHINAKGILPGYKLQLLYNDTKVGPNIFYSTFIVPVDYIFLIIPPQFFHSFLY